MKLQETCFTPDPSLQAKNAEKLEKALAYLGEKWLLKQNVVKKFAVPLKY